MSEDPQGIVGIDLGTTNSVVSCIDGSGKPVVIKDIMEGADTVPSVVYFETDSNVLVGAAAKRSALIAPEQVASMVKREMGNPDFRRTFFGEEHTAPSISALILQALVKQAEASGVKVGKVVITVPAYFGMTEKQATRQAGELEGLDVVALVPEPVAAALAYGLASDDSNTRTILVYDLGGGTFDVTLIELTPDSVDVLVVDGHNKLGGYDWDAVLVEHLSEAAERELGDETLLEDPHFLQDLWDKAEDAKKRLSQAESAKVILRGGGGAAAQIAVTRAEFERLTAHLLEDTLVITRRALETAEKDYPGVTGRITDVILVGGSSLMPGVSDALRGEFGWDPKLVDPHLAVARGAALYAAGAFVRDIVDRTVVKQSSDGAGPGSTGLPGGVATEEQLGVGVQEVSRTSGVDADELDKLARVLVSNKLPKAIGVRLIDTSVPGWDPEAGPFFIAHLVPPQTSLPHEPAEPFVAATIHPEQDQVEIQLWEQAGAVLSREIEDNKQLLVMEKTSAITGLSPYKLPLGSPIHLFLNVTSEGVVSLRAFEPVSGKELRVTATVALLSEEEFEQAKQVHRGLTAST